MNDIDVVIGQWTVGGASGLIGRRVVSHAGPVFRLGPDSATVHLLTTAVDLSDH